MIRLGIVDSDQTFRSRVQESARLAGDIDVVAVGDDLAAAERMAESASLDVLLLDMAFGEEHVVALLRKLRANKSSEQLKVLVTAGIAAEDAVADAVAVGADFGVLKPCRPDMVLARVRHLGGAESPLLVDGRRADREKVLHDVARRLGRIGVAPHFKGYRYLIDAIGLVVHDMTLLHRVTTELYPAVARRHGTTAQRVERAIRNAIEVTMTRGNLEEIERLFSHVIDPSKGKISNSSFIAQLADHVRVELRVG